MHILNIQTPSPPPKFLFWKWDPVMPCQWHPDHRALLKYLRSDASQVDFAWSTAFPELLIGCLCRARAFGRAALSASCVSLQLVSGGFANRQAGLRGRQPHERGLRFPHHQRQTLAQDACYPELLTGRDQSLLVDRFGWWQRSWVVFKVTEESFNLYFQKKKEILLNYIRIHRVPIIR